MFCTLFIITVSLKIFLEKKNLFGSVTSPFSQLKIKSVI